MTKLLGIDAIIILNLPSRKDRLQSILKSIKFSKENTIIFPAVNFTALDKTNQIYDVEKKMTHSDRNDYFVVNPGARGCYISYYRIVQFIVNKGYQKVIILEDDALFHPNFVEIMNTKIYPIIKENKDIGLLFLHKYLESLEPFECIDYFYTNQDFQIHKWETENYWQTTGFVLDLTEAVHLKNFLQNIGLKNRLRYNAPIDSVIPCFYNWFGRSNTKTQKNMYTLNHPIIIDKSFLIQDSNTISNLNYNDYRELLKNTKNLLQEIQSNIDKDSNTKIKPNTLQSLNKFFTKDNIAKSLKVQFLGFFELTKEVQHNTDHYFFINFLRRYFYSNIEIVNENPDIIFVSLFGDRAKVIEYLKKNNKAVKIFFTGENTEIRFNWYNDYLLEYVDIALGFRTINNPKCLRFPLWLLSQFDGLTFDDLLQNPEINLNEYFNTLNNNEPNNRDKFCSIISSWGNERRCPRDKIFDSISQYKQVDGLGKFKHNSDFLFKDCQNQISKCLKHYKFNICIENSSGHHYVTEKIFNCLYGGSVPLYWNGKEIEEGVEKEILNNQRIIYISDEKYLDRVKELDSNPEEYSKFAAQAIFTGQANNKIREFYQKLYQIIKNTLIKKGYQTFT